MPRRSIESRPVWFKALRFLVPVATVWLGLPRDLPAAGDAGLRTETREDGTKKAEGRMVDGKREGLWTFFEADGSKDEEITFSKGRREGPYISYHKNGKRKEDGQFQNGRKAGKWTERDENDQVVEEGVYRDDKKEGPWVKRTGRGRETGEYHLGRKSGVWTVRYAGGSKKQEGTYLAVPDQWDELKDGKWTEWYEDGKVSSETTYEIVSVKEKGKLREKSVRQGPTVTYHASGAVKSRAMFDENRQHGPFTEWNQAGTKIAQGAYRSGKRDGTWAEWDEKGRLRGETVYADGREVQSTSIYYDHKGRKSSRTVEKQEGGKKTKSETEWSYFDSGRMKSEKTTVDGRPDGRWTLWDEQGKVVKSVLYANGVAVPDGAASGPAAGPALGLFQRIAAQGAYDRVALGLPGEKLSAAEQEALASLLMQALRDSPDDQVKTIEKLWLALIDLCADTRAAPEGYLRLTNLYQRAYDSPQHEKIVRLMEGFLTRYKGTPGAIGRKYTDDPLTFSPVRTLHQAYEELGRFEPIAAYYAQQVKQGAQLTGYDCFDYAKALERTGQARQAVSWYEKCVATSADKGSVIVDIARQRIAELKKK